MNHKFGFTDKNDSMNFGQRESVICQTLRCLFSSKTICNIFIFISIWILTKAELWLYEPWSRNKGRRKEKKRWKWNWEEIPLWDLCSELLHFEIVRLSTHPYMARREQYNTGYNYVDENQSVLSAHTNDENWDAMTQQTERFL